MPLGSLIPELRARPFGAREIAGQTTRSTVLCGIDFGRLAHTCVSCKNDHTGADSRHG